MQTFWFKKWTFYNSTSALLKNKEMKNHKSVSFRSPPITIRMTKMLEHSELQCWQWFKEISTLIHWCVHAMCAELLHSYPPLCNPMDYSPPGSSIHGIVQARILEWVSFSFSRGSSRPRDQTRISCIFCIDRWVLYHLHHLGSPIVSVNCC